MHQSLYIGPYLEIAATTVEVRNDLCRQPRGGCADPDPKHGRYCPKCGLDLCGGYITPDSRTEGRFHIVQKVAIDYRDVIGQVEVDGLPHGWFQPDVGDVSPTFDHETKSFKNDGLKRFFLYPRNNEGNGTIRQRTTPQYRLAADLSKVDVEEVMAGFEEQHRRAIKALREHFDEVQVKYGVIATG